MHLPSLSRRLPVLALACAALLAPIACGGSGDDGDGKAKAEPTAGQWKPWVLGAGADVMVAP
ncbi:MAG: glutamate-binding protein, partial [Solirubrobacteraceae bacterium]